MSSGEFWSCLRPDPGLRVLVVICGWLTAAIALLVILTMSLSPAVRAIGCVLCCLYSRHELRRLQRGFAACLEIRVGAGGDVRLCNSEGLWVAARLQTGSLLLRRYAWLRLKTSDGREFAEPLRGDAMQDANWRRLQVIWRHVGAQ